MKPYLGWALKVVALYLLFLIAYFIFAFASMKYQNLAFYERQINRSTFVFWQNGNTFSNPPLFSNLMVDTKGQLSSRNPYGIDDVDIWVFLLEGPEDIKNVEFASYLGIDIEKVSKSKLGQSTSMRRTSLKARLHPIPIFVSRKHVLIMDAKFLRENYKKECLDEMVYGSMIDKRNQQLWSRCKKT